MSSSRGRDRPSRAAPRTDPSEWNYRTGLLPRVSGVKSLFGVGMLDAGLGQPSFGEAPHPLPVRWPVLAPTPERPQPVAFDLLAEFGDRVGVARHGVVGEVPSHHAPQ